MTFYRKIVSHSDYRVYSSGDIFSFKFPNGKHLKQTIGKDGYYFIGLTKNKTQKRFSVARLVALAFIPNPENKPEVNHKNGIKTDNRVENLEWVTRQENDEHSRKLGLSKTKLSRSLVIKIRSLYDAGGVTHMQLKKKWFTKMANQINQ